MATYTELQTRITAELGNRSDLSTQIQEAIQSAIRHYQRTLALFGQDTDTVSTVAGTAEYALDADFLAFDRVEITVDGNTYPLELCDYDKLKTEDVSGHRGEPWRYAYRNSNIRLYPVPDAVYTVTIYQWIKAAAPSGGSDSTAWTNDFLDIIRHRAKWELCSSVTMDPVRGEPAKAAELEALQAWLTERDRMILRGGARPTEF